MKSLTRADTADRASAPAGPDTHHRHRPDRIDSTHSDHSAGHARGPGSGSLIAAAVIAGLLVFLVSALGIGVRAADVGTTAVDEPQYLLTAISLAEDGDLDISNERAQGRDAEFYDGALPVQTSVLDGGRRVSPHDPLLPVMLAPAMSLAGAVGLPGWVGAKLLLAVLAGILAGTTTWVLGTRWPIPPVWAGGVAAAAGMSAPLAVYGHQVYPELPAALAVVIAVAAIVPRRPTQWSLRRAVMLVLAVSALPWLSIKYAPVAAVVAIVALLRMRRDNRRLATATLAAFGVFGLAWIAAHQILYGGWTAYATGDQFEDTGEFSVVGVSPNYLSRSTRLIGILVDRDYGIAAWQPAWLVVLPALGLLFALSHSLSSRGPRRGSATGQSDGPRVHSHGPLPQVGLSLHLDVLLGPLAAGLLTATFAALTMHGYWSPGRQMVVVLPLAAMVIAIAGSHLRTRLMRPARLGVALAALALGTAGIAIHAWTLTAGYAGTLTWVAAPNVTPPPPIAAIRTVLPDYRELASADWALHFGWVAASMALVLLGFRAGSRRDITSDPSDSSVDPDTITRDPHSAKDDTNR